MRLVLRPHVLYLGCTVERAGSDFYVPFVDGRSSWGRCGLAVHVTAGRGDLGYRGTWCLELIAQGHLPVMVRPGQRICQVYFHAVQGERTLYQGRYAGEGVEAEECRLFKDKE